MHQPAAADVRLHVQLATHLGMHCNTTCVSMGHTFQPEFIVIINDADSLLRFNIRSLTQAGFKLLPALDTNNVILTVKYNKA